MAPRFNPRMSTAVTSENRGCDKTDLHKRETPNTQGNESRCSWVNSHFVSILNMPGKQYVPFMP